MRKIVPLIIIGLLLISFQSVSGDEQLPSTDDIETYITTLIDSYNDFIKQYKWDHPNFDDIKQNFSLYSDKGTFEVICVRNNISDDSRLSFIFEEATEFKIEYHLEKILLDCCSIFLDSPYIPCTDVFAHLPDRTFYADFIVTILCDDISNNTNISAKNYAFSLFNLNKKTYEDMTEYNKKKAEIEKIESVWHPFQNDNWFIIYTNETLRNMSNEIDIKISQYRFGYYQYNFELFLEDYSPLNRSVTHFKDQPRMRKELNQLTNKTANQSYWFLFWYNDFVQIFSSELNEIEDNINNNLSYIYANFQEEHISLNQNIQNVINANKKDGEKWRNAFLFFIILLSVQLVLLHIINKKDIDRKKWEYLKNSIPVVLAVILSISANIVLEFDIIQLILLLSTIPIAYFIYHSKRIVTQMLIKIRKIRQKYKNREKRKK